jgi:hypothetical protein
VLKDAAGGMRLRVGSESVTPSEGGSGMQTSVLVMGIEHGLGIGVGGTGIGRGIG